MRKLGCRGREGFTACAACFAAPRSALRASCSAVPPPACVISGIGEVYRAKPQRIAEGVQRFAWPFRTRTKVPACRIQPHLHRHVGDKDLVQAWGPVAGCPGDWMAWRVGRHNQHQVPQPQPLISTNADHRCGKYEYEKLRQQPDAGASWTPCWAHAVFFHAQA